MHEFSIVDGFVEINENLEEMIKYVANEPSVGLYYIQHHVRNAVPNVVNLGKNVLEKSRETVLHTEDLEDSVTMVKSMKECGSSIADEMIGDIKNSLAIMSTRQPRRGQILNTRSPWSSSLRVSDSARDSDSESGNYFSSVLKSAKERASSMKWPQLDFKEQKLEPEPVPLHVASASSSPSDHPDVEGHEVVKPSDYGDELSIDVKTGKDDEHVLETAHYDEFKAGREANLKAWLGAMDGNIGGGEYAAERI